MSKRDGGRAFPVPFGFVPGSAGGGGVYNNSHEGESLRDDFAGKALIGLIPYSLDRDIRPGVVATWAYEYAQAMIEEKNKIEEEEKKK